VTLIRNNGACKAAWLAVCSGLARGIQPVVLAMPLGVAGGVPYVVLVLVGMWMPWGLAPFALAVIGTFLTFYGYLHSPPGGIPWVVLTNRALAIFAIWVTAILLVYARNSERALNEARLSGRVKDEFLARISHELRTPLNAILGFSEIIKEQFFGRVGVPRYLEYAKDIHYSGLHLLDLINDLLDLEKITAGKIELSLGELSLAEFAPDMVQLIEPIARKKEIDMILDIEPRLPLVCADARAVKQMFLNLLSNAVKFTPDGGKVFVHARSCDDGVLVIIEDSGIGIDPGDINKVLSPFGQVKSAAIAVEGGTGLGLPIVKSLIELHGGRLDIQSSPGVGTSVTLFFPSQRVGQKAA